MRRLPQSIAYTVVFKVFLSSDHVTAATGKTVAITISKAGGAFGNPAAGASNATEIANGWYKFAFGTGDTDTLGDLVMVGTATSCDTADIIMHIVKATNGGWTALPDAAAEAAGGLYTRGTGAGQINQDANGRVDANTKAWAGTATTLTSSLPDVNTKTITAGIIAAASFAANALDAVWSTAARTLTAGTNIQLPSNGLANVTAWTVAITGNITGNLSGSVGSVTAGVTLAASAVQAIWDALTSALTTSGSIGKLLVDNVNATISSRMPTTHLAATAGKLDGVALVDTLTTYTGNTPQTGDVYPKVDTEIASIITTLGVAGAGLTALGDTRIANLDATVSSRLASASYTAPPSAATNAAAVWDLDATAHQTQGTFGQAIGDPGADTDTIWGLANTNLDAAVSSRLATSGYTAPLSAADTRSAVGLASANLDTQLDALPTNTELSTALGTADDAVIAVLGTPAGASLAADIAAVKSDSAAVKTKTDSLTFTQAGVVDAHIQYVAGEQVTGSGTQADPWGPV